MRGHFSGVLLCRFQPRIHENFSNHCKIYLLYFAIDYSNAASVLLLVDIHVHVFARSDKAVSLFLERLLSLDSLFRALLELSWDELEQKMAQVMGERSAQLLLERLSRDELLG
jgi:hypothetical protein